jgi:hypothetical protein
MKNRAYFKRMDLESEPVYVFGRSDPEQVLVKAVLEVEFLEPLTTDFIEALQNSSSPLYVEVQTEAEKEIRRRSVGQRLAAGYDAPATSGGISGLDELATNRFTAEIREQILAFETMVSQRETKKIKKRTVPVEVKKEVKEKEKPKRMIQT